MKIAFLLSVAAAIAGVVMVAVMWTVLQGMGVFGDVQDMFRTLDQEGSNFELMDYVGFGRVVSLSVVIGVIDIVLLTAIATLAAFLYNICASLVGGIQLTLSDE
ncbi:membrane protein [Luteipulveratus mongoliensis]|uniref:Membrane protein n=2 Tax=Luteipulveratus mongoliensis TaxID=571913 RepID=A0A0K1JPC7_9MICO|nr:membrane protein [Luteipulveratus mongoliensis]